MSKKANHYIDNKKFLDEVKEYKKTLKTALESGLPKPVLPNYIGKCFMDIATHLAYRPNFNGYSYKDEMIADGIENCLKVVDNFDPEKSENPFAYFTQITYYAFIRRIQIEKKQTYIKGKMIMNAPFDAYDLQEHDEDNQYTNTYLSFVQANNVYGDIIEKEEERQQKKRDARISKTESTLSDIIDE